MATKKSSGVVLPNKIVNKAMAVPPGGSLENGQTIPKDHRIEVNEAYSYVRQRNTVIDAVRAGTARDGTLSAAIYSLVEVAKSGGYRFKAFNTADHQFSLEGSVAAMGVLSRIDTVYDYTKGFADKLSFDMLLEQMLGEVVATGALAAELVLTKERFPDRINVIAYETLEWVSRGPKGGRFPQQIGQGDPIKLDLATFFLCESHRHAVKAYTDSMMAAAMSSSQQFNGFVEEMRRTVRRQAQPRLVASLITETIQEAMPAEIKNDPEKLQKAMDSQLDKIKTLLDTLNPEDALVAYDLVKFDLLKSEGEKSDYVTMLNALSGQLATALKTSPSILGLRITGSQSLSNTESLIFLKTAKSIRGPVEEVMSRALTLAVRLYGIDVYVDFKFEEINLRPEDELEAFKNMKQTRILTQVSEGFITDEEACWDLNFSPRPAGAPKLFGTGFMRGNGGIDASKASPNNDPMGRSLQSDQPDSAGGKDNA